MSCRKPFLALDPAFVQYQRSGITWFKENLTNRIRFQEGMGSWEHALTQFWNTHVSLTYKLVNDPGDKIKPHLDGSSLCSVSALCRGTCGYKWYTCHLGARSLRKRYKAPCCTTPFFSFSQDIFSFQSHTALEALNHTAFRTYYLREKLCENICFQQSCFISAVTSFKLCVLTFSLQMWQWQEHSIFQSCLLFMQFCSFFQGLLSCIIGQSTMLPAACLLPAPIFRPQKFLALFSPNQWGHHQPQSLPLKRICIKTSAKPARVPLVCAFKVVNTKDDTSCCSEHCGFRIH